MFQMDVSFIPVHPAQRLNTTEELPHSQSVLLVQQNATSAVSSKQTEKLVLLLMWMLSTLSGTLEETSTQSHKI